MKRKIEWLNKQIRYYTDMLDHAHSAEEIGLAIRMKRLYESALLELEEKE